MNLMNLDTLVKRIDAWESSFETSLCRRPCRYKLLSPRECQSAIIYRFMGSWLRGHCSWDEAITEAEIVIRKSIVEIARDIGNPTLSEYILLRVDKFIEVHSLKPSPNQLMNDIFKREADSARNMHLAGKLPFNEFPFTARDDVENTDLGKVWADNIEWAKIEALVFLASVLDWLVSSYASNLSVFVMPVDDLPSGWLATWLAYNPSS